MRKLVLISLISLMFLGSQALSVEVVRDKNFYNTNNLEEMEHEFFENGTMKKSPVNKDAEIDDETIYGSDIGMRNYKGMPLLKKYRIKIQNRHRIKEHEEYLREQKEAEKEIKALNGEVDDDSDLDIEELTSRTVNKIYKNQDGETVEESKFSRFKNLFKRNKKDNDEEPVAEKEEETYTSEDGSKPLTGGVQEVIAEKDMILDCDRLNYDDETSEMEATGNPVMVFPPQGVSIKADRLTYNSESNIIKAFDNVEITKNGKTIYGDYVMIDMNDESSIVKNMNTHKMNMLINAKDVVASEDAIELRDGSLKGEEHYTLVLRSMKVSRFEGFDIPEEDYSKISGDGLEIKVKAKEIYVTAKKDHNVIKVKDADIFFKDKHITRWENFVAHTNKNQEYFEANYPEFGNIPRIGMYIGPGFVFDIPNGASIKFIPFLNYKNKFGVGAGLRYHSGTNVTSLYYGSAADLFILKGHQMLDDRLYLQYGINSYLDDWWHGSGIAKYRLEAVYRDAATIKNTLGYDRNATFRQRVSAGWMEEADYNRHGEHFKGKTESATRLKYMAELSQELYKYYNKKHNVNATLSWILQGSGAIYGTGDTQFIARTGPGLHTQYKRWVQDVGFFVSGVDDHTPVPRIDAHRLGNTAVFFRESFRFNKYLTGSWVGTAVITGDKPSSDTFVENGFYISFGPDDLKFTLGYDFIRERSILLFSTALDLKGTQVDYKKMVIKNPDKLTKSDEEKVEPISFVKANNAKVRRTHAQVIEIEDPDREQL